MDLRHDCMDDLEWLVFDGALAQDLQTTSSYASLFRLFSFEIRFQLVRYRVTITFRFYSLVPWDVVPFPYKDVQEPTMVCNKDV